MAQKNLFPQMQINFRMKLSALTRVTTYLLEYYAHHVTYNKIK